MQYLDVLADELIARHGLNATTKLVWKTRGKIPDRYGQEDFEMRNKLQEAGLYTQQRLIEVLRLEKINTRYLCQVTGVPYHTYRDVVQKRHNFSQQQLISLRKGINQCRIALKTTVETCQQNGVDHPDTARRLQETLRRGELMVRSMLAFDKHTYDRVMRWRREKGPLPDWERKLIVDRMAILVIETSV